MRATTADSFALTTQESSGFRMLKYNKHYMLSHYKQNLHVPIIIQEHYFQTASEQLYFNAKLRESCKEFALAQNDLAPTQLKWYDNSSLEHININPIS